MIKTPSKLQDLRRKIYVKSKAEPKWKFWGLYVHVCKLETLQESYRLAKENKGAPGIDGVTFEAIEKRGINQYLQEIQKELIAKTYKPSRAKEIKILKSDGKSIRVLRIPTIRDRIVEGAMKLIIEPIFEADFKDGSYGYRPKRKASDAIKRVTKAIVSGKSRVIDFDLRAYFDTVRHDILLGKIASRIQDDKILRLIKLILKAGGKVGLRQGGVLSPVFSNIYLNEVDSMLERAKTVTQRNGYSNIEYARWADDAVVLIDHHWRNEKLQAAVEKRLREEFNKLKLTVNEEKSKIVDLSDHKNSFQFLGFDFRKTKTNKSSKRQEWTRVTPKKEASIHLRRKLKEIFETKRGRHIAEVINILNPILRGWVNYFRIGNSSQCFRNIEDWVQKKIRRHLYKVRQRTGFGWRRWSKQELYKITGIYHDYRIQYVT